MIVLLSKLTESCVRNRVWLASLGAAAAINLILFWLASIAPMGRLPGVGQASRETSVEVVIRRHVPPPPDLEAVAAAESPPSALPPRFRPRALLLQAYPDLRPETIVPLPRLRLNLDPCGPADRENLSKPECAPPREWLRADRDASDLLGPDAQGLTIDEVAAARGWMKPKARSGQDAMAGQTDSTLPESVFKDPPFPPHAIERTGGW